MKMQIILLAMMLLPMVAGAEPVLIDGIYYNLITKGNLAEVTSNPFRYKGSVIIPDSIKYDGITYNVTGIDTRAFQYCSGLTSITIPKSLNCIRNAAFEGCNSLNSIHITDLASWCNISFLGEANGNGTMYSLSTNPLSVAHHLFLNGIEIKDLVIPSNVSKISNYTFYGCTGLTSVTIPSSVRSIGDSAFEGCSGMNSVTIPSSVTKMGIASFYGCFALTSVNITDLAAWCKIDFPTHESSNPLSYAHHLYMDGKEIKDLIIPDSVMIISNAAFCKCSGLTSITIPNSVTWIGYDAFSGCEGLITVKIGSGVKNIYNKAFASCKELTDVYCLAEKVPSTYADAFQGSYINYATLHVPFTSIDAYKAVEPWKNFGRILTLSGQDIPIEPEVKKCDKPNIIREGNKFWFECETPGATFKSKLTPNVEEQEQEGSEVVFQPGTITYTLTVIASAEGYEDSDPVKMTLTIGRGDVNSDGRVDVADIANIIDIMAGK